MAFLAFLIGYFSRGPVPLKQGQQFEGLKHRLDTLARIMHKFSTASTKSSGVLHRLCCTRSASSTYRTVRLRGPTRKRVPPRVAQRTQVVAFVAS